jgi:YgiT-type zinc finger domain-containing protein
MSAKVSKCFRCGSTEIAAKGVEELVRRGPYVVALRLVADVCASCGERYLQRQDVSTIEDVRRRLERGELDGFRVTGELLEPVAAGR